MLSHDVGTLINKLTRDPESLAMGTWATANMRHARQVVLIGAAPVDSKTTIANVKARQTTEPTKSY